MKRVCKQCGKEFEMTQHEIQFYKKKKLSLPKRCKECREKNKESKQGIKKVGEGKTVTSKVDEQLKKTSIKQKRSIEEKGRTVTEINSVGNNSTKTLKKSKKSLSSLIAALFLIICAGVAGLNPFSDQTNEPEGSSAPVVAEELEFRSEKLLEEHYEKHGIEMGFESAEEYEDAAAAVVADSDVLHKTEKEDGDDVYYLEDTNEFVVVSTDGYIRTYFEPEDGLEYFEKQ